MNDFCSGLQFVDCVCVCLFCCIFWPLHRNIGHGKQSDYELLFFSHGIDSLAIVSSLLAFFSRLLLFFFLLSVVCVAFYLNANLNKAKDRVEIGNWNEDIFKTHVTFVVFSLFFVQRYKYFFGVFSTSSGRVFKCVCRVCFPHLLLKVALSVFWM